jgi:uncharacterized membrane protein YcaP (DUF421 family)
MPFEFKKELTIDITTKLDWIDKDKIKQELSNSLKKYKKTIGDGNINIVLTRHKENLKGYPLIHTRFNIQTKNIKELITTEGWGEIQSIKEGIKKFKKIILKKKKNNKNKQQTNRLLKTV